MELIGTNSTVQRARNRSAIIRLLLKEGPMTRRELVERTELTSGAISNIVKELLAEGVVREYKAVKTRRKTVGSGRPSVPIELNPMCRLAVGVTVFGDMAWIGLYDLRGNCHYSASPKLSSLTPAQLVRFVKEHLEKIKGLNLSWYESLVGLCVALPGLVDVRAGIAKVAPRLNWRQVPLKEMLEAEIPFPCFIENSMRAWTAGEIWFNYHEENRDFAAVYAGQGIGASLVVNGELVRGKSYGAGELGHMVLDVNGPPCSCGGQGCLEALASLSVFINKILLRLNRAPLEKYDEHCPEHRKIYEEIKGLIEARDSRAMEVVDDTARYLALGISSLVNLVDPEYVILTGPLFETSHMVEAVRRQANQAIFQSPGDSLAIKTVPTTPESWSKGAAAVLFRVLFVESVQNLRTVNG